MKDHQLRKLSSIDLSNNDQESLDKSKNPIICFVCDPMCQIRKKSSLFGTLGHNYVLCCGSSKSGTFCSDHKTVVKVQL